MLNKNGEFYIKERVLLAIYEEEQKNEPDLMGKITYSALGIEQNKFHIALLKLRNEDLIKVGLVEADDAIQEVLFGTTAITREGNEYVKKLLKSLKKENNKQEAETNLSLNLNYRIIFINDLIKDNIYPSLSYLAGKLQVNKKTVMRDIETMKREFNVPIKYCHMNKGYYYTEERYVLPLSNNRNEINKLIYEGEGSHLEFKSSLRWDIKENCVNKALEDVILKSISAFSNNEGGRLLIGVSDTGEILGLENDYKSLKKDNKPDITKDEFELHLRNLINKTFGIPFSSMHIDINFKITHEKEVCIINIKRGDEPLFLIVSDKQGQKHEKFYVRNGNRSDEIIGLSNITSYIRKRFDAH